jgi:hypothetical protein
VRANEVTEVFLETLEEYERALRDNHPWIVPTLNRFSKGKPTDLRVKVNMSNLSSDDIGQLMDIASYVGIHRMWARQGRVTYDLNENLAQELYRSTYDRLPGNVFSHLPHINPLVVLPDPWSLTLNGREGLVRGFFVYGVNNSSEDSNYQQTFTNEEIEGIGLLLVVDVLEDGEVARQTHMTLAIPVGRAEFTLEDAVEYAVERLDYAYTTQTPHLRKEIYRVVEEALKPALSILVYMCCDNRDAVEAPVVKPTVARRSKKAPRDRDPFWVEVGWRMGPQLHAARRAAGRVSGGPGAPSGVQRAAHQRAGHFHKFRVGPGRTGLITRWVMPHWVGLGELPEDADPITTVVSVEPQRHDPLRRRGLKARG